MHRTRPTPLIVGIYMIVYFICEFISPVMLIALPNTGVDAGTLPKDFMFVRERWFYADYTHRYDESANKYVRLGHGEYYRSYWSLTEIAYGITDKLTIVANFWYYDAKIKSGDDVGKDRGIGDFYVFSKYKLSSADKDLASGVVGLLALRLPTGDKKDMPILRLGDGSTDIGIGFAATKRWRGLTNSVFAGIWLNNKTSSAVDKRHEVEYRATSEYELLPRKLNLQMELKGLWFEGNKERLLEVVPGIQYIPVFPLMFELSYKITVEARGYFKYDYQVVMGVSIVLPVFRRSMLQEAVNK